MGPGLLAGLDLGTSRVKAVLVDREGREVASASAPTPWVASGGGTEMTVAALQGAVAGALGGLGSGRREAVAAGIAGMAESGALFDAAGRPLAPVVAWHDPRGREQVEALVRRFGPGLALRIGQPVRTVLTAPKLAWLLRHGVRRPARWLGVPEACLWLLSGSEATELSLAARTGCYDVIGRAWIPEVAAALRFGVGLFPPVRDAGSDMGRISPGGSAWSGLPAGIPVTVAGHDHPVGMVGAGVPPGALANSVGTAETVVAKTEVVPDVAAALSRRVAVTVSPGGRGWALLAGAARAGLVLESAARLLGRAPADLDALAEAVLAGGSSDSGPPVDAGPLVARLAAGTVDDLDFGRPGQVWAGLLDALAARTADACGRLAVLAGPPPEVAVFGGGGASAPWLQAKARRLPWPLTLPRVSAAAARGAALYAGVAAGWWPSAENAPRPQQDLFTPRNWPSRGPIARSE